MRKIMGNDEGFIGMLILGVVVLVFMVLFVGAIIQLIIGFLMLVGIGLLLIGLYLWYKNKFQISLKNPAALIVVVIGLMLIIMSYMGLDLAVVDLSMVPGLRELHMAFNS